MKLYITRLLAALTVLISFSTNTHANAEAHAEAIINREFGIDGSAFANHVYQRYYFVKRLEACVHVLRQVDALLALKGNALRTRLFTHKTFGTSTNPAVAASIKQMQEQQSLEPFFRLWHSFARYQRINDAQYTHEFVWETFWLTRNILKELSHDEEHPTRNVIDRDTSATVLCTEIGTHAADIQKLLPQKIQQQPVATHRAAVPPTIKELPYETRMETDVHIDQILMRFYMLQRLAPSRAIFKKLCHHPLPSSLFGYRQEDDDLVVNDILHFTTPRVKKCIEQLHETQTVMPLCQLLNKFSSYVGVHSEPFSKEVLLLICTVYRTILIHDAKQVPQAKSGLVQGMLHMYNNASSFSIEEILDLIHLFAEEIPSLLGKVEFYSNLQWKTWIKKYWWVPPAFLLGAALRVYFIRRRHHGKPGGGWFGFGGQSNTNNEPPPPLGTNPNSMGEPPPANPYPNMPPTQPSYQPHEVDMGWADDEADIAPYPHRGNRVPRPTHLRRRRSTRRRDDTSRVEYLASHTSFDLRDLLQQEAARAYLAPQQTHTRRRSREDRETRPQAPQRNSHGKKPHVPDRRSDARDTGSTHRRAQDTTEEKPLFIRTSMDLRQLLREAAAAEAQEPVSDDQADISGNSSEELPPRSGNLERIRRTSQAWHDAVEQAAEEQNINSGVFGIITDSASEQRSADEAVRSPIQPPHTSAFARPATSRKHISSRRQRAGGI